MSTVYSTEPGTTGRVVIDTTHGPIDIDLWCKECPSTTRTFLQLCLDGYYDGMIFHRILSDFLIQTGLTREGQRLVGGVGETPSSNIDAYLRKSTAVVGGGGGGGMSLSSGGDALGRDRKRLEVNPRIRFNHRGQVAMAYPLDDVGGDVAAGGGDDDEEEEKAMLRYQFFITLDEATFLDAKHVVFGTVSGPTVFNALRIGRTDADEETGVPTDVDDAPPRIRGVRVDYHPFGDMVVTPDANIPWTGKKKRRGGDGGASGGGLGTGEDDEEGRSEMERRRKRRKGKRDLNVLSFGDEERDYEEIVAGDDAISGRGSSMSRGRGISSKEERKRKKTTDGITKENDLEVDASDKLFEGGLKESSLETASSSNACEARAMGGQSNEGNNPGIENSGIVPEAGMRLGPKIVSINPKDDDEPVANSKRKNSSSSMGAVEAKRNKYLKAGMGSSANKNERLKREGETMARLFSFKNKVLETRKDGIDNDGARRDAADDSLASRMANRVKRTEDEERRRKREEEALMAMPGYSGQLNADDDNTDDWMGTKFKCRRHMDQDSRMTALDGIAAGDVGGDGRRMEDYVVLDDKKRRGNGGESNGHGRHRNNSREHGDHHAGSGKHTGRTDKRYGHHRPNRY